MTTVVLGDSRLKGLHSLEGYQASNIYLNIHSGARFKDQKRFKKRRWLRSVSGRKLFIVCLGINAIPELAISGQTVELTKVRRKIFSVVDQIRKYHSTVQIILATIPPKDVRRSAEKYPEKIARVG